MAITNGYTDLDTLKRRLGITDSRDDTVLEEVIEAASRQIDGWCGRSFFAATKTRYFTPETIDTLFLDDDLISVTTLKTDEDADRVYETTWSATDYDLNPDDGPPYRSITLTPNGIYAFPTHSRAVQIAGSWGYASTVPDGIREACLLLAGRYWKRKDAPFGIAGSGDQGQLQTLPGMDPDIKQLVIQYRQMEILGV